MTRRVVPVVLVVLAVIFAIIAVPARYVHANVLDTEGYVEMVGPLASDPAVQQTVADAVTEAVVDQVDLQAYAEEALSSLAEGERVPDGVTRLAPVIANQTEALIQRTSEKLVQSQQFAEIWVKANQVGHGAATSILSEEDREYVDVENGVISIPLDPVVEALKVRLVDAGLDIAEQIEPQGRSIVLIDSAELGTAQAALAWFDRIAFLLPFLVIGLVAGAAAVARRRARTVLIAACCLAAVSAILAAGIAIGRAVYLGDLGVSIVSLETVNAVADAFVGPLTAQLWWTTAFWVLVAVVAGFWPWAAPRVRERLARRGDHGEAAAVTD
ncbi:hypothetical protein [Paraoerskovia marina]|uniref:hypothetical protein n=1 Tax=Paraoerskovia marina TaxID=545619 RepID=UPI0012DCB88E|nr:hypothetical protein [Paraoerskovia marina]